MVHLAATKKIVAGFVVLASMTVLAVSRVLADDGENARTGYVAVLKGGDTIPAQAKPISAFAGTHTCPDDQTFAICQGQPGQKVVDLDHGVGGEIHGGCLRLLGA